MFQFEKRDEGYTCTRSDDGRTVALIETCDVVHSDHVDADHKKPRLAKSKDFVTKLGKDDWRLHFTGTRLTVTELEALIADLPAD